MAAFTVEAQSQCAHSASTKYAELEGSVISKSFGLLGVPCTCLHLSIVAEDQGTPFCGAERINGLRL